jgi:hypothetical protein
LGKGWVTLQRHQTNTITESDNRGLGCRVKSRL